MSDSNEAEDRRRDVELGDLHHLLRSHSYPATTEELLEAYGDVEVRLEDGSRSFEELLGPFPGESFHSADAVRMAVFTLVQDETADR